MCYRTITIGIQWSIWVHYSRAFKYSVSDTKYDILSIPRYRSTITSRTSYRRKSVSINCEPSTNYSDSDYLFRNDISSVLPVLGASTNRRTFRHTRIHTITERASRRRYARLDSRTVCQMLMSLGRLRNSNSSPGQLAAALCDELECRQYSAIVHLCMYGTVRCRNVSWSRRLWNGVIIVYNAVVHIRKLQKAGSALQFLTHQTHAASELSVGEHMCAGTCVPNAS